MASFWNGVGLLCVIYHSPCEWGGLRGNLSESLVRSLQQLKDVGSAAWKPQLGLGMPCVCLKSRVSGKLRGLRCQDKSWCLFEEHMGPSIGELAQGCLCEPTEWGVTLLEAQVPRWWTSDKLSDWYQRRGTEQAQENWEDPMEGFFEKATHTLQGKCWLCVCRSQSPAHGCELGQSHTTEIVLPSFPWSGPDAERVRNCCHEWKVSGKRETTRPPPSRAGFRAWNKPELSAGGEAFGWIGAQDFVQYAVLHWTRTMTSLDFLIPKQKGR